MGYWTDFGMLFTTCFRGPALSAILDLNVTTADVGRAYDDVRFAPTVAVARLIPSVDGADAVVGRAAVLPRTSSPRQGGKSPAKSIGAPARGGCPAADRTSASPTRGADPKGAGWRLSRPGFHRLTWTPGHRIDGRWLINGPKRFFTWDSGVETSLRAPPPCRPGRESCGPLIRRKSKHGYCSLREPRPCEEFTDLGQIPDVKQGEGAADMGKSPPTSSISKAFCFSVEAGLRARAIVDQFSLSLYLWAAQGGA